MNRQAIVEETARVVHEVNRAYCATIGDPPQPAWEEAPDWQRASCIAGVEGALNGSTPEQSHQGWLAMKVSEGWTYGVVKDAGARTHPCMVPYNELPPAQRIKDVLFVTTAREVARSLGWTP